MLLAIDVGNSNVKFGLYLPNGDLCCTWRAVTVHNKMADEYAVLLSDYLYDNGFTFRDDDAMWNSGVLAVPTADRGLLDDAIALYDRLGEAGLRHFATEQLDEELDDPFAEVALVGLHLREHGLQRLGVLVGPRGQARFAGRPAGRWRTRLLPAAASDGDSGTGGVVVQASFLGAVPLREVRLCPLFIAGLSVSALLLPILI